MQLLASSDINDATIDEKITFFGKLKQIGVVNDIIGAYFIIQKNIKNKMKDFYY